MNQFLIACASMLIGLSAWADDSCQYACDGVCDVPTYCEYGTDDTDCYGSDSGNSCQYANDGECDEPTYCSYGTDTNDCSDWSSGSECRYANDGECDEPTYCEYGTDTNDCRGKSMSRAVGSNKKVTNSFKQTLKKKFPSDSIEAALRILGL